MTEFCELGRETLLLKNLPNFEGRDGNVNMLHAEV